MMNNAISGTKCLKRGIDILSSTITLEEFNSHMQNSFNHETEGAKVMKNFFLCKSEEKLHPYDALEKSMNNDYSHNT